jgi:hypothetical protein
LNPADP